MLFVLVFFFFKQKTAYDMRISDWSSDVCSSDLRDHTLDPETRARLTQLMGELYLHLARYADSQRLLDAALEWFKRIKPADDPAIGVVLLDLAERDYYAGALDQAKIGRAHV